MIGFRMLGAVAALLISVSVAHAGTTIVNLAANPTNPNAGRNSSGYAYNPVTLTLGAGVYTVRVAGQAGGGLYDAYSVYPPTSGNAAYTNATFSLSTDNGATAFYTQAGIGGTVADYDGNFKTGRYNTAALAFAAYNTAAPLYTFTLSTAQNVAFYIDDSFGDDSGGISLAVSAIPEPATIGLLGVGLVGLMVGYRRRRPAALA